MLAKNFPTLRRRLLRWYDHHRRDLPWRQSHDPYAIWISEVMLQQTQVQTVLPYYENFLAAFPTAAVLDRAPLEKVLRAWSGLGYYRRAENLKKAARQIIREHDGVLPQDYLALRKLAGVGDYTAGAILSMAFDQQFPAVDGNVSMPNASSSESSLMTLEGGLVHLPVFTSTALLDVELLAPGMLVFESTTKKIRCYNGNAWQTLSATETTLAISTAPASLVPGLAINQSTKHPSSVLEINASGGKAFQLPKVDPDQIYNPVVGLICFNPLNNKLMLFDGLRWNVIL
jgi:hypothetical protein